MLYISTLIVPKLYQLIQNPLIVIHGFTDNDKVISILPHVQLTAFVNPKIQYIILYNLYYISLYIIIYTIQYIFSKFSDNIDNTKSKTNYSTINILAVNIPTEVYCDLL